MDENVKKTKEPATEKPVEKDKYRFVCEACTGIAFTSVEKKNPGFSHCRNCAKVVGADKEENYIPL